MARAGIDTSAAKVHEQPAIDAMPVPRLLPEERGCVGLRLHRDEAVVASKSPASRVPAHAAADVAGEERVGAVDTERLRLEETQPADAAGHVRNHRRLVRRRYHEVPAVVENVRSLEVRRAAAERQILRDAERAADFTLDADEAIDVD